MSFHYDPFTGERVEDTDEKQSVDLQKDADRHQENTAGQEAEPVQDVEVIEETEQAEKSEENFRAIPDEPVKPKKASKFPIFIPIIIAVAALFFVGAVAGAALFFFVFQSNYGKNGKFITAFAKSMEWGSLAKTMDVSDISSSGDMNFSLDAKMDGQEINTEYSCDTKAGKYSLYANCDLKDSDIDLTVFMDKEKLLLDFPALLNEPLLYNYVEEKNGYLTTLVKASELEDLDTSLKSCSSRVNTKKYNKKLKKALLNAFNTLDFEKIDAETFEINDKDKKCKGYKAVVDENFYTALYDELEKFADDYENEKDYDEAPLKSFRKSLKEYKKSIDDLEEMDLIIYLTDGKVARAELKSDAHKAYVQFKGGNYWTENMSIGMDDSKIDVSGDVKKKKESRKVKYNGSEVFSYEYDTKDGDLDLEVSAGVTSCGLKGKIEKSKKKGFVFTVDDLTASGVSASGMFDDFEATIRLEKGANIREISDKDAYDLGNMSEEEFVELSKEVQTNAGGFINKLPASIRNSLGLGLGSSLYGGYGSGFGGYGSSYGDDYGSSYGNDYGSSYDDDWGFGDHDSSNGHHGSY